MYQPQRTHGKQLRIGDTIEVWWGKTAETRSPACNHTTAPLSHLWDKYGGGARLADFAVNKVGMTIEPQIVFQRRSPHKLKMAIEKK